jgi:hypothetical protein
MEPADGAVRAASIDDVQFVEICEPIEHSSGRGGFAQLACRDATGGERPRNVPGDGVVAVRAAERHNQPAPRHEPRSRVSLRKWVEQLMQGS